MAMVTHWTHIYCHSLDFLLWNCSKMCSKVCNIGFNIGFTLQKRRHKVATGHVRRKPEHSKVQKCPLRGHMMLLKRTLFCVFGVLQCVYVVRGSKNTLFSTYCKLLLLLYALLFWNTSVFTKLIVLRSETCSDWPAVQCIVIDQIQN